MSEKIRAVEVLVASPSRNFVTLRVTTEEGLVGLGDATLNGRELAVASYLENHLAPLLIGRDPDRIEDTWQYLYRGGYWRRGPVTMTALAAVDVALWDIKAKRAGMPLYQLLGGASRHGVLVYGHATGSDQEALHDSIRGRLAAGFRAVRIQSGIPGIAHVYGVPRVASTGGRYHYEPASRGASPLEESWDTGAYLRHIPHVFAHVREEFGPELPLLHDVHHRLTPREGAQVAATLEEFTPFWLEDITPAENQEALRFVRSHTRAPLAIGEALSSIWDFQILIQEQLIDYVRASVSHTGGITHLKKLLEFASLYQIKSGMHGPTDISPVGLAAATHLSLAIHNFGIQEYMEHADITREVFTSSVRFEDGYLHPGDVPGIGVDYNDAAAQRFPYSPAYLPTNRLVDGTVHDW